jgi:hypothetical protein
MAPNPPVTYQDRARTVATIPVSAITRANREPEVERVQ